MRIALNPFGKLQTKCTVKVTRLVLMFSFSESCGIPGYGG